MNVLITGGYGFIGAWIIDHLLRRGDRVFVYDLREDTRRLKLILNENDIARVTFVAGDVTDFNAIAQVVQANGITHIIHLAGLQVPTCRAEPILGARVNVLGTLSVFEAARRNNVQRVVYASSAAVYGASDGVTHLPEAAATTPGTHYGVFKLCNEGNARIYFQDHGLASIGLRPWTVYGPGRDLGMTSEPTKAIKAAVLGRPWHIGFGGWTDFQFVDDVAAAFVQCLVKPYANAKSYNLRGAVTTLEEFRQTLVEVMPVAEKLVTIGTAQIPIAWDLDDTALEMDLGPMPKTSLRNGIARTIEIFERLQSERRLDASELETEVKTVSAEA